MTIQKVTHNGINYYHAYKRFDKSLMSAMFKCSDCSMEQAKEKATVLFAERGYK